MQVKRCAWCDEVKSASEFNRRSKSADGLQRICKACRKEYDLRRKGKLTPEQIKHTRLVKLKWRENNPERVAQHDRNKKLKQKYGITLDEYEAMVEEQNGVCYLCGRPEPKRKGLSVDHCHATGIVRKLLCTSCNPGLGHFRDDPELLRRAADYLEMYCPGV